MHSTNTMRYLQQCVYILLGLAIVFPSVLLAETAPERYTNENFLTSYHEAPQSFQTDGSGGFYGFTVSGRLFTQTPVANAYNIRLHRFSIDEAYFYISDRGVIFASSDISAVSMYLSRST